MGGWCDVWWSVQVDGSHCLHGVQGMHRIETVRLTRFFNGGCGIAFWGRKSPQRMSEMKQWIRCPALFARWKTCPDSLSCPICGRFFLSSAVHLSVQTERAESREQCENKEGKTILLARRNKVTENDHIERNRVELKCIQHRLSPSNLVYIYYTYPPERSKSLYLSSTSVMFFLFYQMYYYVRVSHNKSSYKMKKKWTK